MSRLQAALDTFADGDVEEKRALQLALAKAQKQAEELPLARQIQVTKDFVDRVRKRMPAADEKIRVAQVALQEAMDEKEYDIRELPLAEARLERLQKEVAMSRPATRPAPTAPDREAEVRRLRAQLAEMQAAQTPIRPPQSSALSADLLRQRVPNVEQDSPRRFLQIHRTSTDGWWTNTWNSGMRANSETRSRSSLSRI